MSQSRGELTQRIKDKSLELLGYEINRTELRLMVYVQYLLTNSANIEPSKVSWEERAILSQWREKWYIVGWASELWVSKDFWDTLSEIIYLWYVDLY